MITHELLKSKFACESQLSLFKKTFPNGVEVTVETCVKYAQIFDFDWAADNLLKDCVAYEEAVAPLWKAYEEAKAPLLKAYKEAEAPLWEAYMEARASLFKSYEEGAARAFAEQYIKENHNDHS